MQTFTIERDGKVPLTFTGELLATVDTRTTGRNPNPSRWTVLRLYRTDNGRYVAHKTACSSVAGEREFHHAVAFDHINGAMSWFHPGTARDTLARACGLVQSA